MAWNSASLDQLKSAWQEGKAPGVIARQLGPGHTRKMVEREAARMGLHRAQVPERIVGSIPSRVAAGQAALLTTVAEPPHLAAPSAEVMTATVFDVIARGCKWPIGEVGTEGFGFCGRPTATRRASFCDCHAQVGVLAVSPEANRRFFMSALRAADKQAPAA